MNDWRTKLREYDRAGEPPVPDRVERIRHAVIEAARAGAPTAPAWPWRLSLAGAGLVLLAGGAGDIGRGSHIPPHDAVTAPESAGERRQVRFSTPGGTRIIWELNPEFTLMETLP
jgi:hypothetical protein